MFIHFLVGLVNTNDGLQVMVHWCGLSESEDTLEPLQNTYKDVPQFLIKLQNAKARLVLQPIRLVESFIPKKK